MKIFLINKIVVSFVILLIHGQIFLFVKEKTKIAIEFLFRMKEIERIIIIIKNKIKLMSNV